MSALPQASARLS